MNNYYFVTDIETNGPSPQENSMLSFATVAVREDGKLIGEFESVLQPRHDRIQNKSTMQWWKTQPDAWKAATENAKPPCDEMLRFVNWLSQFDGYRSFAARPLLFDGLWMDCYLREYTNTYILDVPHWGKNVFTAAAIDIDSYMLGVFGRIQATTPASNIPIEWLGDHEHTHRAIDDARGYATLLSKLLKIASNKNSIPEDFLNPY